MNKPTDNQYPLQSDIQARWSPYAFAETPLTTAELGSILRLPAGHHPLTTSSHGALSSRVRMRILKPML